MINNMLTRRSVFGVGRLRDVDCAYTLAEDTHGRRTMQRNGRNKKFRPGPAESPRESVSCRKQIGHDH